MRLNSEVWESEKFPGKMALVTINHHEGSEMTTVNLGIDLEADFDLATAIELTEAAPLLRGRSGNPHPDVLRRWANPKCGCQVGTLQLVLPTVKVGGRLLTMRRWVEAFERMRARLGQRSPVASLPRTPKRRAAAQRRAEEELKRAGIGSR